MRSGIGGEYHVVIIFSRISIGNNGAELDVESLLHANAREVSSFDEVVIPPFNNIRLAQQTAYTHFLRRQRTLFNITHMNDNNSMRDLQTFLSWASPLFYA